MAGKAASVVRPSSAPVPGELKARVIHEFLLIFNIEQT